MLRPTIYVPSRQPAPAITQLARGPGQPATPKRDEDGKGTGEPERSPDPILLEV
jgi:hypothetical protein